MESSSSIYCYLHIGGDLARGDNGDVEYKGGRREGIPIVRGMSFDDFLARACAKMNIPADRTTFAYTLQYDVLALIPLKSDEDFTNMITFSDRFARVYITRSVLEEDVELGVQTAVEVDALAVRRLPETIVGSNSVVQCSTRTNQELTMQSFGFSQRSAELQQNDHSNDNPPTNEEHQTSGNLQTIEVVVARMEGRKTEIEGAQRHLNSLIDSYVRDMETIKGLVASSLAAQANNEDHNAPPPPVGTRESSENNGRSNDDMHGFDAPIAEDRDDFLSANMHTNVGGAAEGIGARVHNNEECDHEMPDHHPPPSPQRDEPQVPHEGSVHRMTSDGSDHEIDSHINAYEDATEANMAVHTEEKNDNAPQPSTMLSETHSHSPTMDTISNPMSPMSNTQNINGTQIVPEIILTSEKVETLPNPSNPTRKRRTKATTGRLRKKGPTCKSPFVNYCLTKYHRVNQQEALIADYAFDESRDAMEVLCSYGGYGITRGQMQCLSGEGPLDNVVVTIICRYLNVLEGAEGKRHFLLPSFGDIACGLAMNASKKVIRTKLGKFSKGIDGFDQLFIPICQFNQWVVVGVNLGGSRIDIMSSAPTFHTTHFIAQGRKIAKFLNVLALKAFRRNHIEWKGLQHSIVDLPTHNRTEDNSLYAVLYMLNWDGSGLSRALPVERIGLERLKIVVLLMEAKENELKSTVFCNIFPGQTDNRDIEVAEEDMN